MLLALAELEKLSAQADAAKPPQPVSYERQPGKAQRDPAEAFAKLPVQETIVIEPEKVKAQPEAFEQIGEERTFEVDVVPLKLFKRQFVRPKYRRKDDAMHPPVIARAPARAAAGGYASAGLIAWIVTGKYLDHQPLFQQEQMLAHCGAQIPRQTMVEWIRLAAELAEPVYKHMRRKLIERDYIQVDDEAKRRWAHRRCEPAGPSAASKRRSATTTPW